MDIWQGIVLGVVEGITEFLPVSSTGHLILAGTLLGLSPEEFTKSFEVIIQLGAIASVLFLYWREFLRVEILTKLFVAFLPTGVIGFLLYKVIKTYFIGNETVALWALLLGGVLLIIFEALHREAPDAPRGVRDISYRQAFLVGLFQAVAVVPGVSRSAATILGGLWLGLSRVAIVEFSFLLAVPTMLAASGFDLVTNYALFSAGQFAVLGAGFLVSFLVALASIRFFLRYIKHHNFIPFGVYRILVALLFWFLIF